MGSPVQPGLGLPPASPEALEEDALFKSLTHQVRRDIIRVVGRHGSALSFSEIQAAIGTITSPKLAYHLKSLAPFVQGAEGSYRLSEVGVAAFQLLQKVELNTRIARYRHRFFLAYLITMACWIAAEFLVPFFYSAPWGAWSLWAVIIVMNVLATVNFTVLGILRRWRLVRP